MANIGFIGLGVMGKPMSRNLLKAGYSLVVYDISPVRLPSSHRPGQRREFRARPPRHRRILLSPCCRTARR